MLKKSFLYSCACSLLLIFGMSACVDGKYDLDKGVSLDVKITGNKISFPIGDLKPIPLDSLIDTTEVDLLHLVNGKYSIQKEEVIEPITIDIDDVRLSIDPVEQNSTVSFDDKAKVNEIALAAMNSTSSLTTETVSIKDLNDQLPAMSDTTYISLYNDVIAGAIDAMGDFISELTIPIPATKSSIDNKEIACSFEYPLPTEVESFSRIVLKDNGAAGKGHLVKFHIQHPGVIEQLNKNLTFEITFPLGFVLALDDQQASTMSLSEDARTINAQLNCPSGSNETVLSFYIKEIKDLDDPANYEGTTLKYNHPIVYSLGYEISGSLTVKSTYTEKDFQVSVSMDEKVDLGDAVGTTNPIKVDFKAESFDFSSTIAGLESIDRVDFVSFDAANSVITLNIDAPDFDPFELDEEQKIRVIFPAGYHFNLPNSILPAGVSFREQDNAFVMNSLRTLTETKQWKLALERVDINQKVNEKGEITLAGLVKVEADNNQLVLKGMTFSLVDALDKLGDKTLAFSMPESTLKVDEARVVTAAVTADIDEKSEFNIHEAIDKGIKRIHSIAFKDVVAVEMAVDIKGLDITSPVNLDLDVALPSFLCLESSDEELVVENNGNLKLKTQVYPNKGMKKTLHLTGIDFGKTEQGYLASVDSTDGKSYLQYSSDVTLKGTASINNTEVSSKILENDIDIKATICVSDADVRLFEGVYSQEIDPVEENIDFDWGDDMDFLTDGENSVVLTNPQILINLENTIGVPVLVDLQLEGLDKTGQVIPSSVVKKEGIHIQPAQWVNGELTAGNTHLLVAAKPADIQGYETIVIENLSQLLKTIPHSIRFKLIPKIDETQTHRVDLSKEQKITGNYSLVVPIQFDELHLTYTDRFDGLQEDWEKDITDRLSAPKLTLRMKLRNTLPLGLTLQATAIDEQGNALAGATIASVTIAAGTGEAITDTNVEAQELEIVVDGTNADISQLDGFDFTIKADASTTAGGISLSPQQGVQLTNLVLTLEGDIETNLDDDNK